MSLWFPWLEYSFFLLVTEACEVPTLMTRFALKPLGWTLETFNVNLNLHTSDIPLCSFKHSWHQSSSCNGFVTCIILVTDWSRFHTGFSLLVLACWEVCALMSHQIDLSHLGVTCHLIDVPGSHLITLHLPCKLPDLVCRNLAQVYVAVINCLGDKFLIFQEKPNDVPVKDLGCFWGVLSQSSLGVYYIVPFINWLVSLLEACEQVKYSLDLIRLQLARFFKLFPNGI